MSLLNTSNDFVKLGTLIVHTFNPKPEIDPTKIHGQEVQKRGFKILKPCGYWIRESFNPSLHTVFSFRNFKILEHQGPKERIQILKNCRVFTRQLHLLQHINIYLVVSRIINFLIICMLFVSSWFVCVYKNMLKVKKQKQNTRNDVWIFRGVSLLILHIIEL